MSAVRRAISSNPSGGASASTSDAPSTHMRRVDPELRRVGRYWLVRRIASGGFGTVHLGVVHGELGFERVCAVKQLHPHLAEDPDFRRSLLDEARIAASIDHPNVCAVQDFGVVDGELFLTMEFVVGEPFSRMLKLARQDTDRALLTPGIAAYLVAEAAEGLHAAHEAVGPDGAPLGIVHRDVAPSNLFVTYEGRVKVLDFGIAKAQGTQRTATGVLKGHYSYIAPEQLSSTLDRRADVFALGVVLWELLAQRSLFRREDDLQTLLAVQNDPVPSLRSVDPALPAALDAIVMRALRRHRDERYPTAKAFADDLRAWLASEAPEAGPSRVAAMLETVLPNAQAEKRAMMLEARRVAAEATSNSTSPKASLPSAPRPARPRIAALAALAIVGVGLGAAWMVVRAPAAVEPARVSSAPTERAVDTVETVAAAERSAPAEPAPAPAPQPAPVVEGIEEVAEAASVARPTRPAARPRRTRTTATASEAAPATAAQGEGTVAVTTLGGWAQVFAGDRHLGETPLRTRLPAGRHTLRIVPASGAARTQSIEVRDGETTRVSISLE